jgi:SAM-dependent methyltransferase
MIKLDTDREWEEWGVREPYYGVITRPEFRSKSLGDAEKQEFFASGRNHMEYLLQVCRARLDPQFKPSRALDFGCGVGRVTFALASMADTVVGVDVAHSMLREAEANRQALGVHNVVFVRSDDDLSSVEGSFDFIHSFIVFQHLEVHRGRSIFAKLLQRLSPGGVFAAHFTYGKAHHPGSFGRPPPAELLPQGSGLDRHDRDPVMLMNPYDVNEILFVMQRAGIAAFFTQFTDHGGELGILLYMQK